MEEESTPLIAKADGRKNGRKEDDREQTIVFNAIQAIKARRHILLSLFGFAIFITVIILLLLTPMGCIFSSTFSSASESIEHFVTNDVLGITYLRYPAFNSAESSLNITDLPLRIVLLGDSLINKPYQQHDLGGKIQKYLSQYPYALNITNCGFNGHMIASIREEPLTDCALPLKPHAVIVFWDSDCSNVQEYDMTDDEVTLLRSAYLGNVAALVSTLVDTGKLLCREKFYRGMILKNRIMTSEENNLSLTIDNRVAL